MHLHTRCILASISANFSPIFKIFFSSESLWKMFFENYTETAVSVVSVLQAPLFDIKFFNMIYLVFMQMKWEMQNHFLHGL